MWPVDISDRKAATLGMHRNRMEVCLVLSLECREIAQCEIEAKPTYSAAVDRVSARGTWSTTLRGYNLTCLVGRFNGAIPWRNDDCDALR